MINFISVMKLLKKNLAINWRNVDSKKLVTVSSPSMTVNCLKGTMANG